MMSGSESSSTPSGLHLTCDGESLDLASLVSCEALLATDRPDRLELSLRASAALTHEGLPAPGRIVSLQLPCGRPIRAAVERVVYREAAGEPGTVSLVASSEYHQWRDRVQTRRFAQVRPGEVAHRLAVEMGLHPVIEDVPVVLPSVEFDGDPLRFLRRFSEAHGLGLAVTDGTLYCLRSLQEVGDEHVLHCDGKAVRIAVEHDPSHRRLAVVSLAELVPCRPLDLVLLRGHGPRLEGEYRVLRSELCLGPEGWRSDLVLIEGKSAWDSLNALAGREPAA